MPSPREVLQTFAAVVVTGGSSGIGKSFIELCGKLNPQIRFCNLSRTVPSMKDGELMLCHVPCDLGQVGDVERAAAEVEVFLTREVPAGRVLLINNSGFGSYGPFPEPNLARQDEMLRVNICGLVGLTGRLLPGLKARGGAIVNIASTAAFQPTPFMATYGASKAFVLHWSLALTEELRGSGVHVLAVCPGPTETAFFRRAGVSAAGGKLTGVMTSEAVVEATFRALAAGRSLVVPGWRNRLMTAASGLGPKPWVARVAGRMISRFRVNRSES